MISTLGYAAKSASTPLESFSFERKPMSDNQVLIDILYCGICHSDIHQARNEWGGSIFPMVPGHEIVGRVSKVGSRVSSFKVGDLAGVGCFVDSCRTCTSCRKGVEQYCEKGLTGTYNSRYADGTPTYGGYSNLIAVDEKYTLHVPQNLDLAGVAPLLCAGITTYSPLRHWKVGQGHRLGVIGLGGLGHMAVKFGASFGAEVTVFSTSPSKAKDAANLGAHHFVATREPDALAPLAGTFDFLLNTVSAPHDINSYLQLLKLDGTMIIVGVPPESTTLSAFSLIGKRRSIGGSLIGGIKETQEMLDYCGKHSITSDVETISAKEINGAYERMIRADVKYRFVLDTSTL
jgi:alcohol dehydrogenase (NADP+)